MALRWPAFPDTLQEAIKELEEDTVMHDILGNEFVQALLKTLTSSWDDYKKTICNLKLIEAIAY